MRAALLALCASMTAAAAIADGPALTLDDLRKFSSTERVDALARLRGVSTADTVLQALSTQLTSEADARRESGQPPLFPGCLRSDEFELSAQLKLAYQSADAQTFRALSAEYHRLSQMLRNALRAAQASGNWRKNFAHLRHWISDWSRARDPAVKELLHRTLTDQALRASLSAYRGKSVYFVARPSPALRTYDEYVFNLMCTSDEDNLNWLKDQVARNGWFDIQRYGRAADQAAWLMVQHADGAPAYQAYIAALLEVKARSGETDPRNYAFLSDRIAVRAGRPQPYGTQMECVKGEWLKPEVEHPQDLDTRRAALGLPPMAKQLSQRGARCQIR